MQIDSNVAEADVGVVEVDQKVDFTVDAFPHAHLSRQSRAGAQRADHGAERRHLRHRHRREQSGSEIETGHDGERFNRHRARDDVLKIAMRRCVIVRRMRRRLRQEERAQVRQDVRLADAAAVRTRVLSAQSMSCHLAPVARSPGRSRPESATAS